MTRPPKWWRWLRATLGGYFWKPCDLCRDPFGGHELHGILPTDEFSGRMICVLCAVERQEAADRRLVQLDPVPWYCVTSGRRESPMHAYPYSVERALARDDAA